VLNPTCEGRSRFSYCSRCPLAVLVDDDEAGASHSPCLVSSCGGRPASTSAVECAVDSVRGSDNNAAARATCRSTTAPGPAIYMRHADPCLPDLLDGVVRRSSDVAGSIGAGRREACARAGCHRATTSPTGCFVHKALNDNRRVAAG